MRYGARPCFFEINPKKRKNQEESLGSALSQLRGEGNGSNTLIDRHHTTPHSHTHHHTPHPTHSHHSTQLDLADSSTSSWWCVVVVVVVVVFVAVVAAAVVFAVFVVLLVVVCLPVR